VASFKTVNERWTAAVTCTRDGKKRTIGLDSRGHHVELPND
jgi:hypothetical protein